MKDNPVILVVDDHPQDIELLEAHLVPWGYDIVTASNGREALEKLIGNHIDLILLDVMMPGMDGFEVTRRIRQSDPLRMLPIILVTALWDTQDRIKGIESGCDDFITKPYDKAELLARVRSLLKVKAYNDLMSNYQKELKAAVAKSTEEMKSTLQGSIKILTNILELTNPEAFHTAQLSRKLMNNLCKRLQIADKWEYDIAAMLSQIGLSILPPDIIDKYRKNEPFNKKEKAMFNSHPDVAQQLIGHIPMLENIAAAIGYQMAEFSETLQIENQHVASMSRMLKLALDFVISEIKHPGRALQILAEFKETTGIYDPEMLNALEADLTSVEKDFTIRDVTVRNIQPGMILADNILDENDMLILPKGTEMTEIFMARLVIFVKSGRNISKVKVLAHIDH